MPWSCMMFMTSIRDSNLKKEKKKIFRPTYPIFGGHVTGNTHTFLFGLITGSLVKIGKAESLGRTVTSPDLLALSSGSTFPILTMTLWKILYIFTPTLVLLNEFIVPTYSNI